MPTWSHDGELDFLVETGECPQVAQVTWRTRVGKGSMEQVPRGGGGYMGRELADRKTLLYQPTLHLAGDGTATGGAHPAR